MTSSEFAALMTRIDAVGIENRGDIRGLTRELARTRESLASCQSRCWVQADTSQRRMTIVAPWVSAMAAVAALVLSAFAILR